MVVTDEMIDAAAISDAAFDGLDFKAMSRVGRERYRSRAKAGLTAALSALPAGVKTLEWDEPKKPDLYCSYDYTKATGAGLTYQIEWKSWKEYPGYCVYAGENMVGTFNTLEAAKSAAFEDYSARILSALSPAGVETGECQYSKDNNIPEHRCAVRCIYADEARVGSIKFPLPSWREQAAFEEWAKGSRYEMHQHPLHYLFMDKQTNAARQGWKAALAFVQRLQDAALPTTETPAPSPAPSTNVAGISDEIRAYLEGVVGVVEANSFESMCLWQRWQEMGKSWVSTGHGYLATVGHVGDMPVCISILTATVDGEKILFIDPTSQVVDYRMVEEWLKTHVVTALRDDGYLNRADAMNFSNVLGRRAALATTEGKDNG